MDRASEGNTWSIMLRLVSFVKPYKFMVFCCCVFSVVNAFTDIIMAYLIKGLINTTLDKLYEDLFKNVSLIGGITVLGVIAKFLTRFLAERVGIGAIRDIRKAVLSHIAGMKLSHVVANRSGDLVSRLINNINIMKKFLENELYQFIYQPLIFLGAFTYLWLINWKMLAVNVSLILTVMLITIIMNRPLEKYMYQLQGYMGEVNATAQDIIAGISLMKAYNLNGLLFARYGNVLDKALKKSLEIERRISWLSPALIVVQILPLTISVIYGGYLTFRGGLIPGELVSSIYLLGYLSQPVIRILNLSSALKMTAGAAAGLFEILDAPLERVGGKNAVGNSTGNTVIEFNDVSFSYNGEAAVLDRLSFKVNRGKKVAVVGPSGSGKSTIIKLLGGFYEPRKGEIKLNGCLISKLDLDYIRSQFSVVSQDIYLFPVSIAANIAFGKKGAGLDEVIEAAKIANAHSFIMKLPQAYNTIVGERGTRLSGGQRQLISIARAVLNNAPIMLLDEATSALDNQSETLVREALDHFLKARTVLIIAHRLSAIKEVDEIIVLKNGENVEQGTHNQLMQKKGLYSELYTRQFYNEKLGLEAKENLCLEKTEKRRSGT